jgi:tocopherol O-methyltransferase
MNTGFSDGLSDFALKERVQRFYDITSPLYLKIYGENIHDGYYITGKESKEEAQQNLTREIAGKARISRGDLVLDVGCGVGGSSLWLAEHLGAKTVGITISPVQVEIATGLARARNLDSSFLLMDAEHMQFPQTFDVLWVVASSTHFQSQENFIRSAATFLKPGGRLAFFDWTAKENISDVKADPFLKPVCDGMLLASLSSLSSLLSWFIQSGFRVTYAEDITLHTLKTWDDALSVITSPVVWRFVPTTKRAELTEALHFYKTVRAMKLATVNDRIKSAVIVVEKI